jgi:DtxR family Mn-dependent transcriptional regulator
MDFTAAQQDYVKALWHLGRDREVVTPSELGSHLGVSAASATEMSAKLAALGLVERDRFRGAALTAEGERVALEMIRHHRLIEMFLTEVLGYAWDEVHEEAERLEHVISERMEDAIFEVLGRPAFDPHGHPIPERDGRLAADASRPLAEVAPGERVAVRRVSDRDPEKLRALHGLGLLLGSELVVVAASRFESPVEVLLHSAAGAAGSLSGARRQVPLGLAREVYVVAAEAGPG